MLKNILNILLSQIKAKYTLILKILGIIILILVLFFFIKSCKKPIEPDYKETYINNLKQQIKIYKDDSGRIHARLQEISFSKENDRVLYIREVDSLSKLLKIKSKQIDHVAQASTETKDSGKVKTNEVITDKTKKDVINGRDTTYLVKDTSYALKVDDGHLKFNGLVSKDSTKYNYVYKDSLTFVQFHENYGFLGLKKRNLLDVSSSNPKTTITNAKGYSIQDSYKNFISIGIGAQYSYMGASGWKVTPGIGVYFDLITIKRKVR